MVEGSLIINISYPLIFAIEIFSKSTTPLKIG
jgi:hypothetical protein